MQKGKVLIKGGTSGLGFELVKCFLQKGFEVFATGRDPLKLFYQDERLHFIRVDFSDLADIRKSIRELLDNVGRFDKVINNAGVLSPPEFIVTGNDIEYSFQVNFLSHLLIDELIVRSKTDSDPITIVSVTSPVYKYVKPSFRLPEASSYQPFKTYAESKFYILLIGEYLLIKYPEKNLKFIGYDPGTFSSGIYRMQKGWFQRMYQIAAPFMRNPAKVAWILTEILEDEELISEAVYWRKNGFRNMNRIDKEPIDDFMKKCFVKIESYII